MTSPFEYEREIDAIRAKLYEESKLMTQDERIRRANARAHELAKQYGWKIIPAAPPRTSTD